MKNKRTYYQLILDQSGSMSSCIRPTIDGYNEQIQMIRDLQKKFPEQEFRVSLTIFNHFVDHRSDRAGIEQLAELNEMVYVPDGGTALLDAIGESVTLLNSKIAEEVRRDEATAVVVILTDGHENSSRLFSLEAIRGMIRELEAGNNWTFSFLGATRDALEQASNLNIKRENSLRYDKANTREVFHELGSSMAAYVADKAAGKKSGNFLKK